MASKSWSYTLQLVVSCTLMMLGGKVWCLTPGVRGLYLSIATIICLKYWIALAINWFHHQQIQDGWQNGRKKAVVTHYRWSFLAICWNSGVKPTPGLGGIVSLPSLCVRKIYIINIEFKMAAVTPRAVRFSHPSMVAGQIWCQIQSLRGLSLSIAAIYLCEKLISIWNSRWSEVFGMPSIGGSFYPLWGFIFAICLHPHDSGISYLPTITIW